MDWNALGLGHLTCIAENVFNGMDGKVIDHTYHGRLSQPLSAHIIERESKGQGPSEA